ncbi:TonB-linked outer membrane protein, SusC/RagA family [Halpernia frigidisoli]|uniref:TonB-linked outer membrane protein, SusC/RagA family n=2 Tax=Halpernia frigidisoli TaxID=1125876 RepID=A0A1I3E9K9_9FLAO|nr:TonB-linked outer membrane protein, SusC/RagA family [Halpernia frigidisoli]
MKTNSLKFPCLVAALYFGMSVNAQQTQGDSASAEKKIEEVVLVGYGTQKKDNITGSIGVISAKDLANKPNANPLSSIQGKISGVQIINSGSPGTSPRVDIRGIGSLTGKTVFIVDGNITDDISFLNPQDVESMSVLKDPSSLAIYGARASNGAVIIKTKTGKGKPVFNFNNYYGIKTVTNVPKLANGDQYVELYNEKLLNDTGSTNGSITRANYPANTDWFKEIFRTSMISSNDFSGAGKVKNLTYYASVGNLQDEGNLAAERGVNSGSGYNRLSTKLNLSYKINDHLTIGNNFTFVKSKIDVSRNPLLNAYNAPPVYDPIDPATGNYQFITLVSVANPRAQLDLYRSQIREERLLNNVFGEYKFLQDFTLRVSYSTDNKNASQYEYVPVSTYLPNPNLSNLVTNNNRDRNYIWDNTLAWKKSLGKNNIELLAGFSRTRNSFTPSYRYANNVNYDGSNGSLNIGDGTEILETTFDLGRGVVPTQYRIESYFGRLNYDFNGKYLLNGSIRRDGSSKYPSSNRFKYFPAISAGWVISKEEFMSGQNFFNLLKLRGSYGRLGNPDVALAYNLNVTTLNSGAYYGNTGSPAQTIDQIVDKNIDWEITTGKDFGIEMAMLNNDLKIEATYFDKDSKNVVYGVVQGTVSGAANYNNYVTNAYSFNNKGLEASVNYDHNINENIKFGVYANYTALKNRITSVFGGSYLETGASLFGNSIVRLQEGQAVGSYYGYQVAGVFQNSGEVTSSATQNGATVGGFKFSDIDGNGIIDARDKTFLGSPVPKGTYGFGLNFNVKNVDFAIDFQGVFGNKIYNFNREQRFGNENWDEDIYNNRWTGPGTSNSYSLITNNQAIILPSSFYVEDGSYIRIRNIQFGYTLPKGFSEKPKINKVRIYLSAQNPWTSFKYHGFSPEILNGDRVQLGIDNNIYPISAIYSMGMNLTF